MHRFLPLSFPFPIQMISERGRNASPYFAILDLASMCYSVPIIQDSRPHFAFSFKSMQYTFTLLPMGYLNIPIIAYNLCRQDLNSLTLIYRHIWHYIDEIILWGLSEDAIQEDLHLVTQYLQQKKDPPPSP